MDIKDLNSRTSCSIDGFLNTEKKFKKVSEIDLTNFIKISEDTLIHKSDQDLWQMAKDADGNVYISRLFEKDLLNEK